MPTTDVHSDSQSGPDVRAPALSAFSGATSPRRCSERQSCSMRARRGLLGRVPPAPPRPCPAPVAPVLMALLDADGPLPGSARALGSAVAGGRGRGFGAMAFAAACRRARSNVGRRFSGSAIKSCGGLLMLAGSACARAAQGPPPTPDRPLPRAWHRRRRRPPPSTVRKASRSIRFDNQRRTENNANDLGWVAQPLRWRTRARSQRCHGMFPPPRQRTSLGHRAVLVARTRSRHRAVSYAQGLASMGESLQRGGSPTNRRWATSSSRATWTFSMYTSKRPATSRRWLHRRRR